MDPSRKRRIRLTTALTCAVLLAGALVYTSFSASSEAVTPGRLLASAQAGQSYQLTGKVVDGTIVKRRDGMTFRVRDRAGTASIPVSYAGSVPDPFRDGREIIITVKKGPPALGGTFVGEKDSLVTKCPSKFENKKSRDGDAAPSGYTY